MVGAPVYDVVVRSDLVHQNTIRPVLYTVCCEERRCVTRIGCAPGCEPKTRSSSSGASAGGCGTKPSISRNPETSHVLHPVETADRRPWPQRLAARGFAGPQQQALRTYTQALAHSFTVKGRGRPAETFEEQSPVAGIHPTRLQRQRRPAATRRRDRDPRRVVAGVAVPTVVGPRLPRQPRPLVTRRSWSPAKPPQSPTRRWDRRRLGCHHHRDHHQPGLRPAIPRAPEALRGRAGQGPAEDVPQTPPPGPGPVQRLPPRRRQAAKLHKKTARQTTHDARVWANRVVANHALIAVEDFKPKFLAKSTMARKAADAAVGTTKRTLVELGRRAAGRWCWYARLHHHDLREVRNENQGPSRAGSTSLHCDHCGNTDGRDRNAARVILAVAERGHAGADDV